MDLCCRSHAGKQAGAYAGSDCTRPVAGRGHIRRVKQRGPSAFLMAVSFFVSQLRGVVLLRAVR